MSEEMPTPAAADNWKMELNAPYLRAYRTNPALEMPIIPAPSQRGWMDNTHERFAYRCLPLLIANQSGWFILSSHRVSLRWNGGETIGSTSVEFLKGEAPYPVSSHFGHGIVTWNIPYVFRTPPGYNLLVRGPANYPKDGLYPLDGVVETDWSTASFTINWKITRPNLPLFFDIGEPICMIVPQKRGELEAFQPEIREIESDPEFNEGHNAWADSRLKFLKELLIPGSEAEKKAWQKDYFQGHSPEGAPVTSHQTKLKLRHFNLKGWQSANKSV